MRRYLTKWQGGQARTKGGQSGIVRHGFPPFLPGRTRTHPYRGVRLSGKAHPRTEFRLFDTLGEYQRGTDKPVICFAYRGSFSWRVACGVAEPRKSNLFSKIGTPS